MSLDKFEKERLIHYSVFSPYKAFIRKYGAEFIVLENGVPYLTFKAPKFYQAGSEIRIFVSQCCMNDLSVPKFGAAFYMPANENGYIESVSSSFCYTPEEAYFDLNHKIIARNS